MANLCLLTAKDCLPIPNLGYGSAVSSSVGLRYGNSMPAIRRRYRSRTIRVSSGESPGLPAPKKILKKQSSRRSKADNDRPWWKVIFRQDESRGVTRPSPRKVGTTSTPAIAGKKKLIRPPDTQRAPPSPSTAVPRDARNDAGSESTAESTGVRWTAAVTGAPLVEALRTCAAQGAASFHFPAHRRGSAAPPALVDAVGPHVFAHDLPDLPELDSLFAPAGPIAEAQAKAALAFGADATFFLVNGTTCGVQAAVMATCRQGDTLILPRNCHVSAISAMVLSGTRPWYVIPDYDSNWGVCHGVTRDAIAGAITRLRAEGTSIGAVLIVSPTYYGVCSPVREIASLCQENEIPLIVDEAHGAHFRFHDELPETALAAGADMVVQSTHKVLGALTQASMLHVRSGGRVDRARLQRCLQLLQSSSPSYLLLASLDAARAQLDGGVDGAVLAGAALLEPALDYAAVAREQLRDVHNLFVMDHETMRVVGREGEPPPALDPLRITVGLWGLNIDGYQADEILRTKLGVVAELPGVHCITFACSIGTTPRDIARLVEAWRTLSLWHSRDDGFATADQAASDWPGDANLLGPLLELPSGSASSPRDAFFSATVRVPAEDAVGRISAEVLCPYPPGIPVVTPGEIISEASLKYLRNIVERGGTVTGGSDPLLKFIVVCERDESPGRSSS